MESSMTFSITDEKELKAIKKFKEEHYKTCKVKTSAGFPIGPIFTYSITPTEIGVVVSIRCSTCGKEENVTNYNIW